jgi:hypothetical protein
MGISTDQRRCRRIAKLAVDSNKSSFQLLMGSNLEDSSLDAAGSWHQRPCPHDRDVVEQDWL